MPFHWQTSSSGESVAKRFHTSLWPELPQDFGTAPLPTGTSCGIFAWQDCLEPVSNRSLACAPAGLRHGNPVHRCLCGIPAWRSGLQSTLRHSDPTHRYFRGIYAWRDHLLSTLLSRDPCPQVLQSHLHVAKQSSIGPFVHETGPFCGRRGLDRVFLHEMGPFCGRRGPE